MRCFFWPFFYLIGSQFVQIVDCKLFGEEKLFFWFFSQSHVSNSRCQIKCCVLKAGPSKSYVCFYGDGFIFFNMYFYGDWIIFFNMYFFSDFKLSLHISPVDVLFCLCFCFLTNTCYWRELFCNPTTFLTPPPPTPHQTSSNLPIVQFQLHLTKKKWLCYIFDVFDVLWHSIFLLRVFHNSCISY